jgi:Subtilase family
VAYVAKNGVALNLTVPANTDLLKLVSDHCGTANARRSYFLLFLAVNSSNDDIRLGHPITTKPTQLTLPACLYADEAGATVNTTNGGPQWSQPTLSGSPAVRQDAKLFGLKINYDRLSQMADLQLTSSKYSAPPDVDSKRLDDPYVADAFSEVARFGIQIADTVPEATSFTDKISSLSSQLPSSQKARKAAAEFETALRNQDIATTNQIIDYTKIPTGQKINASDFAPHRYTFAVRPELDATQVARGMASALGSDSAPISVFSDFEPYISKLEEDPDYQKCVGPVSGQAWPFDAQELRRVLELRKTINRQLGAGRMLVLDTGFPPAQVGAGLFDKQLFIRQRIPDPNQLDPGYVWLATSTDAPKYFVPGVKGADHGIGVLTVALGGMTALQLHLFDYVSLTDDGFVIPMMGFKSSDTGNEVLLDDKAVSRTLLAENWQQMEIDIVNMSLRFKVEDVHGSYRDDIRREDQTLFVFAAGNHLPNGLNLDNMDNPPATWGGRSAQNVITVGSVDANDKYSYFSNRGASVVDIAAPGCTVPTFAWDVAAQGIKSDTLDGTSVASPLVAYAANILKHDYGVARIKAHLLGTGRYLPDLEDKVWSHRVLDLPTAIAVHLDILRDANGKIHYGHIGWSPSGETIEGLNRSRETLKQLSDFDPDSSSIHAVVVPAPNRPTELTFPSLKLGKTELLKLPFQEMVEQSTSPALGPVKSIDVRQIQSLTLCDLSKCYWN